MAVGPHQFKRIVLGLQPSAPDRTLRLAVELADLLQLELLGLFLEDTGLHDLARIPFAREFRPLGGGWHPIDLDRLSRDLDLAARATERMFADAAKRLPTKSQFEVIRGRITETIAAVSRSGDIVMIAEPASPAERATQQFAWLIAAAFRSAAAVMLVPTRIARTTGPVVAIAAAPDDPSIDAGAAFAAAAKEELVVVATYEDAAEDQRLRATAAGTGLTIRHVAAGALPLSDPAVLMRGLHHVRERLVLVTRGVLAEEVASTIAATRQVPVLVIEPPDAIGTDSVPRAQSPRKSRAHRRPR
jgi:hypothetical protein